MPGRNCPISFAVLRIAEWDAMASLPGRDLEVEPGGDHVLGEDRARPTGNGEDERDAGDRAVLHALRAGSADHGKAARLEIEHRVALRVTHQRLGAGARGEAHLDPPRCVRGREERLRPGRVVPVCEDRLGAVDRERLGVGDEAADRELEVAALLDGALRHHPGPARLRSHEQRNRVQRRVPRHPDRRLHLCEAARGGLGGVGREQRRVLLQVRDVGLVAGHAARAQLLEREHQLHRVEHPGNARELRGRQPAREPDELGARDVDVDQPPCDLDVREGHRLPRNLEIEAVSDDEAIDDVEVGGIAAVHAHDATVLDDELRLGVVRPVRRDEAELGERRHDQLLAELLGGARARNA